MLDPWIELQLNYKGSLYDVCSSEAQKRSTATDIAEVVVGVCDVQKASVLSGILVRVTDQGSFGL